MSHKNFKPTKHLNFDIYLMPRVYDWYATGLEMVNPNPTFRHLIYLIKRYLRGLKIFRCSKSKCNKDTIRYTLQPNKCRPDGRKRRKNPDDLPF